MNETELLFSEILKCDRLFLYQNSALRLGRDKSSLAADALKRRIRGEPLQYILGKQEFMGLSFKVSPAVLIPRPETEILVETVIKQLSVVSCQLSELNILDLGTGSGCIAVSLAKLFPDVKITAVDISSRALNIAQDNARLNGVAEKIRFIESDLFTNYDLRITDYDIIVSNPPYIPSFEIDNLQPELQYEPPAALDGGNDGLDFYRRIIAKAPGHLRPGGFLVMEMGFNQRPAIEDIFGKSGYFKVIEVVRDYNGIERVIIARLKIDK